MPDTAPRIFGLAPGIDFPAQLVAGLRAMMHGSPPEAMARVTLILNTQRMRRRVAEILTESGAAFLPKLVLVTEVGAALAEIALPAPLSPLQRRLDLSLLLDGLIRAEPTLFPRTSLFDLADSLADLMDEMQGEGVSPARVAAVNVADHSAHWARTRAFLGIVAEALTGDAPDTEAVQRLAVEALVAGWQTVPPEGPVILAGSTGSRGTTALLMQAVARLPTGAVVLPGFDFDLPAQVWSGMTDTLTGEDHPQFRFRRVLDALGVEPAVVRPWTGAAPPDAGRNRLISLSLRPAPVTDQWLTDGPELPDLLSPTREMTLIDAPSERAEAMAIALILREAAETGTRAALITPDRNLTRRVAAVLDRWGIRPDDSAGQPLALSAPGRFLRHVAGLFGRKLTAEAMLTVLKHPLCFSGPGRGAHLMLTRDLELHIRRNGPAFPDASALEAWAGRRKSATAVPWASIVAGALAGHETVPERAVSGHVATHRAVAEALARGFAGTGAGELWDKAAGIEAQVAMAELEAATETGLALSAFEYAGLFDSALQRREVREAPLVHPGIMIRGTLEARVQGADLVILGGLNEGVWPAQTPPDPWLNRQMRREAGLLLPERRVGLSAHDYQQAVAAPRVVLCRPLRSADAETVPSRWLNRLTNLMAGLPMCSGPLALSAMRARGQVWLDRAAAFEAPVGETVAAGRPSPRPPEEARPKRLSLTEIKTLIRDPYAIYARHVLKLRPLDPLRPEADPRLRGVALHEILEAFVREGATGRDDLMRIADAVLAERVAWPLARTIWRARLDKAAAAFLEFSAGTGGVPVLVEEKGAVRLDGLEFTLTGKPDRIDLLADGRLMVIDYKTGNPPSPKEQEHFDKQLLLAAAMAEQGAFAGLGPSEVARIAFVGVKAAFKTVEVELAPGQVDEVWARFGTLMTSFSRRAQGYTARRAMQSQNDPSDYDHLSRFGEWDQTADALAEEVG